MWASRAVLNIPIINGYKCNECRYSAATIKVMVNHFGKKHQGLRASQYSEICKVQLVFKARLNKYIQAEENEELQADFKNNSEWKIAIDSEFEETMTNVKVSEGNGNGNLHLMNVFIAKTHWDVMVEGRGIKGIVAIAGFPMINSGL
jgi:hypothetical protein